MDTFIVKSRELTKIASEVSASYVGAHIMGSLREQRQRNIFCDVCIKVGSEEVVAHRSI